MKKSLNKTVLLMMSVLMLSFTSTTVLAKRQPAMEGALRALDNAERILRKAIPNKGGHRAKALLFIRKAKKQVRLGIEFANRRGGGSYKHKSKKGSQEEYYEDEGYREKEKVMKKRY